MYQTGSMHSFSQIRAPVSFLYSIWDRPATSSVQTISHGMSGGVSKNNGTSENRDGDVFKYNYVLQVVIALMGGFVLFFWIYVVTYIFLKFFRKNCKGLSEANKINTILNTECCFLLKICFVVEDQIPPKPLIFFFSHHNI